MSTTTILHVVDLTAIVVGALTGALLAARERLALAGFVLFALVTGLGGGLVRDLLLADGPPRMLTSRVYLPLVVGVAVAAFYFSEWLGRPRRLLLVLDGLTLGFFTAVGVNAGFDAGLPAASVVLLGTVTAVGGGVLRDLLLGVVPELARPGTINNVAAVLGALLLTLLLRLTPVPLAAADVVVIAAVAALRVVAVSRGWAVGGPIDVTTRLPHRRARRRRRTRRTSG